MNKEQIKTLRRLIIRMHTAGLSVEEATQHCVNLAFRDVTPEDIRAIYVSLDELDEQMQLAWEQGES